MARRGLSVIGISSGAWPGNLPLQIHLPPSLAMALLFFGVLIPESLSIHFLASSNAPVWVTDAVAVTVLLRCAPPAWPGLMLLQIAADTAASAIFGDGFAVGLGIAGCDAFEILAVAISLRWIGEESSLFSNLGQICRFAFVCMVVPVFSAAAGAVLFKFALALPFAEVWTDWYLSAMFGLLIVTPFLLMWTNRVQVFGIPLRAKLEVILLAALVGAVGVIDLCIRALPGMFLCFPFLLLAAFRGGLLGATTSAVVLTVVASWLTLSGLGPIATDPATTMVGKILLLQLYLAVVLLSSLPVAVMLEQRKLLSQFQTLAELSRMARHDTLTGLPNRLLFKERLIWEQARTRREGGHSALLMLDLDRFKPVNDLHGHAAGDRLLELVAERLRNTVRETDTVARLGGDEFAIICHVLEPDMAQYLSERVLAELSKPFAFMDLIVQIGCSVGIALSPSEGMDIEILAQRADAALYRAKGEGRNCFRFFEAGMDDAIRQRAELEVDLREAITSDRINAYYQPIVTIGDARIVGFEMLARWNHATRGDVSPAVFIPVAEKMGMIGQLTEQLLRRGCRAALSWPEHLYVSVNISPLQMRDHALTALVGAILDETRLPPQRLEIEITETALINDFVLANDVLVDLKATGLRIALDDFGTGYSSLRHLQDLPLDKIKIDMGFIRSMRTIAASRKIVAGIIGIGHSLGLPIVAEGVEDSDAARDLHEMGCDLGQGWLYGKAMPADQVQALLGRKNEFILYASETQPEPFCAHPRHCA